MVIRKGIRGLATLLRMVSLIVVLTLVAPLAYTQTPSKEDSLYSKALTASILQMEKQWAHIDDSYLGIRTDYRHMLVEKDIAITDGLPTQFDGHSVDYLDRQELINRCRKLKKPFAVLHVFPIRGTASNLTIHISVYWVDYNKKGLRMALADWS